MMTTTMTAGVARDADSMIGVQETLTIEGPLDVLVVGETAMDKTPVPQVSDKY